MSLRPRGGMTPMQDNSKNETYVQLKSKKTNQYKKKVDNIKSRNQGPKLWEDNANLSNCSNTKRVDDNNQVPRTNPNF